MHHCLVMDDTQMPGFFYAYLKFKTEAEAKKCISELNGCDIGGNNVQLSMAPKRKDDRDKKIGPKLTK